MSQQPSGSNPVPGPNSLGDKFETYVDFLKSILDKRPEYRALYLYLKAAQEQSLDVRYHGRIEISMLWTLGAIRLLPLQKISGSSGLILRLRHGQGRRGPQSM